MSDFFFSHATLSKYFTKMAPLSKFVNNIGLWDYDMGLAPHIISAQSEVTKPRKVETFIKVINVFVK